MVSVSFITILTLFSLILIIGFVVFTVFWLKIIIQLKQKSEIKLTKENISSIKSIYERMGDDSEATEQYIYMRRKLTGG